jgi:undecaprenyl diphosphate synthase
VTKEKNNLPAHVAIVMDGNGRWAKAKGLPRIAGHREGGESVKTVVRESLKYGIEVLTLWAFGMENWQRSKEEVDFLMDLFYQALNDSQKDLQKNNIRLRVVGAKELLSEKLQKKIALVEEKTKKNFKLNLNIAISYSGKWDIINAVKKVALEVKKGKVEPEKIDDQYFANFLSLSGLPDPDLFIRTSGEQRLSNFMLWQLAYTELYFTSIFWPDFREEEFARALDEYKKRERRYGMVRQ